MILTFAYTSASFVAKRKTVTRREWTDRTFEQWKQREGDRFDAWDKSPRLKGKPIGSACLVSVTKAPVCEIPDSDWEAEGFAYMENHNLLLTPEMTVAQRWSLWKEDKQLVTAVVRFDSHEILEGLTPEMFWSLRREAK